VRNQSRAATERNLVISAFKDGIGVAINAPRTGKKLGSVVRRVKKVRLKRGSRTPPISPGGGGADPARSSRKADFAFQRAMRRAIAQGLEHPPMIGVFKDARPLEAENAA